jgi:hypothetical protein
VPKVVEQSSSISETWCVAPDAGRTDQVKYEDEGAEERDGIIVPPYLPRVSRKTSVGGDDERDKKQGGRTDWGGSSVGNLLCGM